VLPCYPATPCLAEQVAALDDRGMAVLDTAPQGTGTVLGDLRLTGDTLSWTNGGAARQTTLR
ncbi:MAG: hypothetical protein ACRDMX_06245, partial [Solirubrobacteraceae bacterium]